MRSSHALDRLEVSFDDDHAVASAGLLLPTTLAARLGIEALVNAMVELGDGPGAANPGRQVMTLIHSMVAGGDCIDDADVLRVGSTAAVLGHRVMAPSTLGTFLPAFTFGPRASARPPGRGGADRGLVGRGRPREEPPDR